MLERIGIGDIKKEYIGREGAGITIDQSGITLTVSLDGLTSDEKMNYTAGKIQLGLLEKWGMVFIFYKFGDTEWGESVYSVNFPNEEMSYVSNYKEYEYPKSVFKNEKEGIALTLILIEGTTGEVRGLRVYGTPNAFSKDLINLLNNQIENGTDKDYKKYTMEYMKIQNLYTTKDLVKMGKIY